MQILGKKKPQNQLEVRNKQQLKSKKVKEKKIKKIRTEVSKEKTTHNK